MAVCFTEALDGSMLGDAAWALLANYRSRLLLGHVPVDLDRNTERKRLQLWEQGALMS